MNLKIILFILFVALFMGCGGESSSVQTQDSSITPQPNVENEAIRPPKPPAI